jgi:uncharacterized protein YjiS (DUF1127 family)
MTLIAIEGRNLRSNLYILDRLTAIRLAFAERYRRWRRYRTTVAELRQYSDGELIELGISRYDIEQVALLETLGQSDLSAEAPQSLEARNQKLAMR